jgi:Kef-type K+ transport system membrane component KefB
VTGASLDLSALLEPQIALLAVGLGVVGVLTKALGGLLGSWSLGRWEAATVGFGMVPRGEVGIVVANLGLAAGLLSAGLFSAVLVAVVITTIVAPYLLAWSIPRIPGRPGLANEGLDEGGAAGP